MANYLAEAASSPPSPSRKKSSKDASPQSSITFVYQTKVEDSWRCVTVTWCKSINPSDHSLCMKIENPSEDNMYICKIDSISSQCWGKKGLKSFEIEGKRVEIFWDFRHAKFSTDPRPCSDYYVAMVYKNEVLLLLGDLDKEAYERTRSTPSEEEATLLYKKEIVYGKKLFCTRAMLEEGKTENDIAIEISLSGPEDPEMWVSIDGVVATRIMNLNWRFRGNETVIVNNCPVQILWDVHDWLFHGSGHGLFIFKPGSLQCDNRDCPDKSEPDEGFCHFLYAWRIK